MAYQKYVTEWIVLTTELYNWRFPVEIRDVQSIQYWLYMNDIWTVVNNDFSVVIRQLFGVAQSIIGKSLYI